MELLKQLQNRIIHFERKEFYQYAGALFGAVFIVILGLVYYYFSKTSELHSTLKKLNKNRQEVQQLLQEYKIVEKQKEAVNDMLDEERNFKLKSFFDNLTTQFNLRNQQQKEAEVTEELLHKKYTEIRLTAQFRQITMQQLCELLNGIEQKQRVYTKELVITKTKGAALDVILTIATIKPQTELRTR